MGYKARMLCERLRGALAWGVLVVALLVSQAPVVTAQSVSVDDLLEGGFWLDYNAGLLAPSVQTLAVDPQRSNRLYAGSLGFLYRSLDGGETWMRAHRLAASGLDLEEPSQPLDFTVINIDDLTDEQLALVDERLLELEEELFEELLPSLGELNAELAVEAARDDLLAQALEEILREFPREDEDPAIEFQEDPELVPDHLFRQIVVDPEFPSRIYAASGRGVLLSTNFGASWDLYYRGVSESDRRVTSLALTRRHLVAATRGGIRLLSDGTWRASSGPITNIPVDFVAAAPSDPERLYAIAEGRVYHSSDGGENWTRGAAPQGVLAHELGNLAVSAEDPDRVYLATAQGVLISSDGGARFSRASLSGLRSREVTWVALLGEAILAGTLDGVYASRDDGASWQDLPRGLAAARVHQIVVTHEDRVWITTNQGIYRLMSPLEVVPGEEAARMVRRSWLGEPDLAEVMAAALAHYGFDDLPVDAWERRIFWSWFMPRAQVRYRTRPRRRVHQDFVPDDAGLPVRTRRDFIANFDEEFRVFLTWNLARIFETSELQPRNLQRQTVTRRRALMRRVIRTFEARRTLMIRIAEGRRTTLARQMTDRLRLDELTAELDLYTGGYFTTFTTGQRR